MVRQFDNFSHIAGHCGKGDSRCGVGNIDDSRCTLGTDEKLARRGQAQVSRA